MSADGDNKGSTHTPLTLDSEALDEVYDWVDQIPLSRVKRNMARDFSDGVLVSEIIHYFCGSKLIELHNYVPASGRGQKKINWATLNRKVFAKLAIQLSEATITKLTDANRGTIEEVLHDLRQAMKKYNQKVKRTRGSEHLNSAPPPAAPSEPPNVTGDERSKTMAYVIFEKRKLSHFEARIKYKLEKHTIMERKNKRENQNQ